MQSFDRIFRFFISIYIYTCLAIGLLSSFIFQVLSWLIFAPYFVVNEKLKVTVLGRILRFFCILMGICLNPFWQIKIIRPCKKNYNPMKTLVMVNHQSGVDPWIVSRALFPWEFKFIFKADLLKIPIAGWALSLAEDLPIYFTKDKGGWGIRKGSVAKLMKRCKELHDMNIGQVIFPEGTRSYSGSLQPFKDGFFRLAIENNCDILPCVLHNSYYLWPHGSYLLNRGTAYFVFGDPFKPKDGETVDELKQRVRDYMLELLCLCPSYNPEKEKPSTKMSASRGFGIIGSQ